ncbi:hypothetical protein M9H77_22609 [Catharanthus roseus]|uniref:Uncharacterized protein n=1 Tax=Catharanthus roseus TaxID=4058 RepID=A0ACC0AV03_CATRO|nr:hypothetical protein M9H77_22609 [Catharanthus roseus]
MPRFFIGFCDTKRLVKGCKAFGDMKDSIGVGGFNTNWVHRARISFGSSININNSLMRSSVIQPAEGNVYQANRKAEALADEMEEGRGLSLAKLGPLSANVYFDLILHNRWQKLLESEMIRELCLNVKEMFLEQPNLLDFEASGKLWTHARYGGSFIADPVYLFRSFKWQKNNSEMFYFVLKIFWSKGNARGGRASLEARAVERENKEMSCITLVSYSIMLNSIPRRPFTPSHGIQEGDLLFFYIFILCSEGFSALLQSAEESGTVRGFDFGEGTTILHLLFADYSLLFAQANFSQASQPKSIFSTVLGNEISSSSINPYEAQEILKLIFQAKNNLKGSESSSTSSTLHFWIHLWGLHITPKAKVFIWRLYNNILPIRKNLLRRITLISSCCATCPENEEDILHIFFRFRIATETWLNSNISRLVNLFSSPITYQAILEQMISWLAYDRWLPPKPPDTDRFKLNVDVAWTSDGASVVGLIRDYLARVRISFTVAFVNLHSLEHAETVANGESICLAEKFWLH